MFSLACATPVVAHTKSASYSNWRIEGASVHLSFTVPLQESARLTSNGDQPSNELVGEYLSKHLSVSAAGANCPITAAPKPLTATVQFRRFEMTFQCPSVDDITLHSSVFFEYVPSHVSLAQIQTTDGTVIQQLFTIDKQTLDTSGKDDAGVRNAGFLKLCADGHHAYLHRRRSHVVPAWAGAHFKTLARSGLRRHRFHHRTQRHAGARRHGRHPTTRRIH